MPDHKVIIEKLKVCITDIDVGGDYKYKHFDHLYDRLMNLISDKIIVSSEDYRVEYRRLEWTMYSNINIG